MRVMWRSDVNSGDSDPRPHRRVCGYRKVRDQSERVSRAGADLNTALWLCSLSTPSKTQENRPKDSVPADKTAGVM